MMVVQQTVYGLLFTCDLKGQVQNDVHILKPFNHVTCLQTYCFI